MTELSNTEGDLQHPVHLHLGDISMIDADITALLTPVEGKTGKSETYLSVLADESTVTYTQLLSMMLALKFT